MRSCAGPAAERAGEVAPVAQDQTGTLAETGTERGPLEVQPSAWHWVSRTVNVGFLLRIRTVMNTRLLSQEHSPALI